jgi:hypothetical protein
MENRTIILKNVIKDTVQSVSQIAITEYAHSLVGCMIFYSCTLGVTAGYHFRCPLKSPLSVDPLLQKALENLKNFVACK